MGFFDLFRRNGRAESRKKEIGQAVPFYIHAWNYRHFHGELLDMDVIVACIDALARNLGKMELQAVRKVKEQMSITDRTKEVDRVLKKPNKYMTSYDFIYKVAALYYATNNVFIWPEYDSEGKLQALWPINYKAFKIYEVDGKVIARFELQHNHFYSIPYSQIIHLRNHFFNDPLYGDENSPFMPICELMHAQNQGIIEGIKSSAIIRGLLKAAQVMKEEDIEKARAQFKKDNYEMENNGGVIVIDSKFDYKQIDSKPYVVDADTREQTKKAAFEYFGVNEDFLTNNFTSEKYEAVYEGRLEPFAVMFTGALTAFLFTEREQGFGNLIQANMAKLKYQPLKTITEVISTTRELGLFTRDEYRMMLGYEPLGPERGGDDIMIATNNYTASADVGQIPVDQEGESNE